MRLEITKEAPTSVAQFKLAKSATKTSRKHDAIEIYGVVGKINPPRRFFACIKNNENGLEVTRKKVASKPCRDLRVVLQLMELKQINFVL